MSDLNCKCCTDGIGYHTKECSYYPKQKTMSLRDDKDWTDLKAELANERKALELACDENRSAHGPDYFRKKASGK